MTTSIQIGPFLLVFGLLAAGCPSDGAVDGGSADTGTDAAALDADVADSAVATDASAQDRTVAGDAAGPDGTPGADAAVPDSTGADATVADSSVPLTDSAVADVVRADAASVDAAGGTCLEARVTCPIQNGAGEKICAAGIWSACQPLSCDPGFFVSGNLCAPQVITGTTVTVDATTVANALASAACGDAIVFSDGDYSNVDIDIADKQCTAANPLLLAAETIGGVTFTGSCSVDIGNSAYIIVDGFTWQDATRSRHFVYLNNTHHSAISNSRFIRSGPSNEVSGVIHLETDCHHNVVKNNYFEDLPSIGLQIRVWDSSGYNNQYNVFKSNHFFGSSFASELIQLGNGMYDNGHADPDMGDADLYTVVEWNLFEDTNYVAELISDKTSYNVHRHNTFRNVCDSITLRHGTNTTVASNFFLDSRGVRIYDDSHTIVNNYFHGACTSSSWSGIIIGNGEVERPDMSDAANHYPTRDTLIAFNTLIGLSRRHMNFGPIGSVEATELQVVGNIVVNEDYEAMANVDQVDTVTFADNIVHSTGSGSPGYQGAGVTVVDPQLTFDGALYQLGANSPARGAASMVLAFDVEGKPRREQNDVGALAFGGVAVYAPLTALDVGPGVEVRVVLGL